MNHRSVLTRGQFGRHLGRLELVVAGVLVFVVEPFLFVAAPGTMGPGPMSGPGIRGDAGPALLGLIVLAQLLAFGWMLRIHRANPEPDQSNWRYRAR